MTDPKKINVPNIQFSLVSENDEREELFSKQRIERGFDDSETWSLRDTIANFIIPRLERYEEFANETIKRDPQLISEINDFLLALKLISRDEGICIWTADEEIQVKKGLDVFPKVFMSLWW